MTTRLLAAQVQRFKAITDAPFDLEALNVLVGANNSGKSSIIQGLHFGVGLLQAIALTGRWSPNQADLISTSINPTELLYSPSDNVSALALGGKLLESGDSAIKFSFTLASGRAPSVSVRKGRNRNILVAVEQASAAIELASLEKPYSIFSPGLAGIAKAEQYLSDGVLLRTIARGDANLVLRNILLRLSDTPEWGLFLDDIREIFPDIDFHVQFRWETDEFIAVDVRRGAEWLPLDLAGTGVLQATQILSYIHRFAPTIVVLDEPDSHLHPNNQRLMCELLRRVAEERNTQVLLTTHSRHVVDAIADVGHFLWVRGGTVEVAESGDQIAVLLDIGALDVKERIGQSKTKVVVLTEDRDSRLLKALLEAAGFDLDATVVAPYYGVTNVANLKPLIEVIRSVNPGARVVLHRDRDYLSDPEVQAWEADIQRLQVDPFVTDGVDIEATFLSADHLAALNETVSAAEFARYIDSARASARDQSVEHYVNGRIDIARKAGTHATINHGQLAIDATKAVDADLRRWSHGKTVLRRVRGLYQDDHHRTLRVDAATPHVAKAALVAVAKKVFGQAAAARTTNPQGDLPIRVE